MYATIMISNKFQKKSKPPFGGAVSDTLVFLLSEPLKFASEGFKILSEVAFHRGGAVKNGMSQSLLKKEQSIS